VGNSAKYVRVTVSH